MATELGHRTKAAFKKNPATAWGGAPLLLGANDGFELLTDSVKPTTALHENKGNFASAFQRPGSPGNYLVGGDVNLEMYYQCFGHRFFANLLADAVTPLSGGAHRHDFSLLNTNAALFDTLAIPGDEGVREVGCLKVTALKLRWSESEQRGMLVATIVGHDYNINVGSPNDAFVVASVAVATGPMTILAPAQAIFTPSPLTFTKVVGITAIAVTIKTEDRWGNLYTKIITQADFVSEVFTDTAYSRRVVSINIDSFTGAGNVKAGVSNGVNNASTLAAITMEASRECTLFTQLDFLINRQGDAALAVADEQFLQQLEITVQANTDQRVTSQFGNRIDEPSIAGGGSHAKVMVSLTLSAHTDRDRARLFDAYQKNQLKAKATITGPQIASSGLPHKVELWLNGLQLEADGPVVSGAGVQPVTFSGEGHLVAAVPSGFPAGVDEPFFMQITNGLATAIV